VLARACMLINRMRSSAVPLTCSLLREQSKTPLPPSDLRVIQQAPQTLASAAAPEAEAGERGDRASPGREAGRASPLTGFFAVTVGWSMAVSPVLCDIPPPRRCAVSLFPLSARTGVPSIKPADRSSPPLPAPLLPACCRVCATSSLYHAIARRVCSSSDTARVSSFMLQCDCSDTARVHC
jgi:hypothetical protein